MSMKPSGLEPVPRETRELVERMCPRGTLMIHLRDALGQIYHDEDFAHLFPKRGRAAQAPWRLTLITVMQALEGLTDRQAAEAVLTRLDWRYALSLPLEQVTFDASMLSDVRQRLLEAGAVDLLLEPLLQIARQRGWLKAHGKQRTDATAVLARVRALSSLESVGESMRAALNALAEQDRDWLSAHVQAEWFERYVHRFELARFPKAETQRQRLREQVGQDVGQLLAELEEAATPTSLSALPEVAILRQVFAQHYEQQQGQVRWRDGPAVSNEQRLVSPYDIQARSSRKRETTWLGYKVHLTETCDQEPEKPHLIIHVHTTPATLQDSEVLAPIQQDLREHEVSPAEHYVDAAYPSGAELVRQAALGTQIIGPVAQDPSWQEREGSGYALGDFELDWQQQQATCPQGQHSVSWSPRQARDPASTILVRFASASCQQCQVREQCTHGQGARTLTLRPEAMHAAIQQRRAEQSRPAFLKQYALRAGVEGSISQAVRTTRLRRSPYDGLDKTHLHHVAIAAALNLKRIEVHLQALARGKPTRAPRTPTPFARLSHQRRA